LNKAGLIEEPVALYKDRIRPPKIVPMVALWDSFSDCWVMR